jgi:hypothetical protein
MDYEQILSVVLLSSLSEVEGSCDYNLPINDYDLIMGLNWFETGVDRNK